MFSVFYCQGKNDVIMHCASLRLPCGLAVRSVQPLARASPASPAFDCHAVAVAGSIAH